MPIRLRTPSSTPPTLSRKSSFKQALPDCSVSISIDDEGRTEPVVFRSGEALRGHVSLSNEASVQSVVVRCYWQSTTAARVKQLPTFDTHSPDSTTAIGSRLPRYRPGNSIDIAEYHRGYALAGGEGVVLYDATSNGLEAAAAELEFAFVLPTTTKTAFANPINLPPSNRAMLMNHERTPPPSYRSKIGSIDWFVEVIVTFDDSTLQQDNILTNPRLYDTEEHECKGHLYSNESRIVQRATFAFEPLDSHARSSRLDDRRDAPSAPATEIRKDMVPSLSRDPRDELQRSCEAKTVKSLLVAQTGGPLKWMTYEKVVKVKKSTFSRPLANLLTQVSIPKPAKISRQSKKLPILLHFSLMNPKRRLLDASLTSAARSTLPAITIDHVSLVLFEKLMTRTGAAERPSMVVRDICRQRVDLASCRSPDSDSPSASAETRSLLMLSASKPGIDVPVNLDLQLSDRAMLSFSTPNIEREYVLGVSVHPSVGSGEPFMACRVPVHVVAGDDQDVPTFEDVVRLAPNADGLPAYSEE